MSEIESLRKSLKITHYLIILLIGLVIFGFAIDFASVGKTVSLLEEKIAAKAPLKTQYLVQNLKGDAMATWYSWTPRDSIIIHIANEEKYSAEIINAVKNAILSTETIEIDNSLVYKGDAGTYSTYWLGWKGAIDHSRDLRGIEKSIEITFTDKSDADIIITLTNSKSAEGISGQTSSTVDESTATILRSYITIYEVDEFTAEDIGIIMRHEIGHVAGLAHSTAPEDLMYPVIQTEAPYISQCDLDALVHLYTGGKTSEVICEN